MNRSKVWLITFGSSIVAIQIILGSLLSVQFLLTKISFSFIAMALSARVFRPHITAGLAALAYTLGMILFPKFTFFPGFILTAFLAGLIFGYALYKKVTLLRIMLANFLVTFGVYLFLNSLWLNMLYQTPWSFLLSTRFIQEVITFTVYTAILILLFKIPTINHLTEKGRQYTK
ncbi:folate family ECF transporter S component [Isobaculum melis]|uniref:ECF transporter S component, folate family n=1 Tax=Isobaculum melis TaxID=142588 RepID=A0A1H9QW08_9LACT|nr:folate family ECF transporter S component [Isobaculum melis]SER64636.1 ECF transporter S component, folate family [Isobaculum melis]